MSRLLVVGGTGFIGRHLARAALNEGLEVTILSLNLPATENRFSGVHYIDADIADAEQLRAAISSETSYDYVVNLSGYVDHSRLNEGGDKVILSHYNGLINLLMILDRDRLKRFVQIGSSDEYGNAPAPQNEAMREAPISPYSQAKVSATHLLQMLSRTESLPAVVFRLFLVYGPEQDSNRFLPQVIQACLSGDKFPASGGEQLRDFCFISDVTRGIIGSLTEDRVNGEVINLASGKSVTIKSVIEMVGAVADGCNPEYGKIPYRKGENMKLYADIGKAKEILGWRPVVSLQEGIEKTVNYYVDSLNWLH